MCPSARREVYRGGGMAPVIRLSCFIPKERPFVPTEREETQRAANHSGHSGKETKLTSAGSRTTICRSPACSPVTIMTILLLLTEHLLRNLIIYSY